MNENQNYRWDWFLLECQPGMMPTAKVEIIGRGVEFLHPKTWRRAFVEGRFMPVPEPMLPGRYAFVRLPCEPDDPKNGLLNEQGSAVETLRGVRQVFKNSSRTTFAPVQRWEIQALKDREATEEREAGKAKPKFMEPRFKGGTTVRIVRHDRFAGHIGEFLYSVRGQATIAMENGIKLPVPDCDIVEVDAAQAKRLVG